MSITADFHLHTAFSWDSREPMEKMIEAAIHRGLTEICFTEHLDLDYPYVPEGLSEPPTLDTDAYRRELFSLRKRFQGKISTGFGVELGVQPHLLGRLSEYVQSRDFDFVIASTHVAKGQDPYFPSYFDGIDDETGYRNYFQAELSCMRDFSEFDVYGHIDYVVRYGAARDQGYCYEKYRDLFDPMIDTLLEKGKGIEINTGSLRKGLSWPHPCLEFLRRYRNRGGEIVTIGSDAHAREDVGAGFRKAGEALADSGFQRYYTFRERKPIAHRL